MTAAPFVAAWACFLPLYSFFWWLPGSVIIGYLPLPESIPCVSLMHLYATFSAIDDAEWQSWWSIGVGTFILSKAMGMAHEYICEGFEPIFFGGREGHGAGTCEPDILDKDGKPLGAQTVLVPGSQLRMDLHDGGGCLPYIIPGKPVFHNERQAIEGFFTKDELAALKSSGIKPWEASARTALTKERADQIRDQHGLWRELKSSDAKSLAEAIRRKQTAGPS